MSNITTHRHLTRSLSERLCIRSMRSAFPSFGGVPDVRRTVYRRNSLRVELNFRTQSMNFRRLQLLKMFILANRTIILKNNFFRADNSMRLVIEFLNTWARFIRAYVHITDVLRLRNEVQDMLRNFHVNVNYNGRIELESDSD